MGGRGGRQVNRSGRASKIEVRAGWLMVAVLLGLVACAPREASIAIDAEEKHQHMRGWEVTVDIEALADLEPNSTFLNRVFEAAANDVGINRLRLEVRSGAENTDGNWSRMHAGELTRDQWRPLRYVTVNDNDDPSDINWAGFDFSEIDYLIETIVLPMRRQLEARGERLFINLCYVAFTKQIKDGTYIHDDPEEYAEFVLAVYLHIRQKYGFIPDSFEAILEPDLVPQWRPRLLGEAIAAAARRLRENGIEPAFVAPSTTDMAQAPVWIDAIAEVDGAMSAIVELSYHRYRNASPKAAAEIAERAARHDRSAAMLEWWFGRATAQVLYEDLTIANAAAWQGRVLGTLFKIGERSGEQSIDVADETRLTRQYFRNVRLGAQRLGAYATETRHVRASAFVNPDGAYAIIADVTGAIALTVTGVPPGRYRVSYVLENGELVQVAELIETDGEGVLSMQMPGKGIIAFVSGPPG